MNYQLTNKTYELYKSLVESFINGNKPYVATQYKGLTAVEQDQFLEYVLITCKPKLALSIYFSLLKRMIK